MKKLIAKALYLTLLIFISSCYERVPEPIKTTAEEIKISESLQEEANTFSIIKEDSQNKVGGGCNFDLIAGQPRDVDVLEVKQSASPALFTGWAVISMEDQNLGKDVWLKLSGINKYTIKTRRTNDRHDVATYFKKKELYRSGFSVTASLTNVDICEYTLSILIEGDDGIYECGIVKKLVVL